MTILHGLEDKPLPDDLAGDFLKWIADLAEDSIENDDGLKEVRGVTSRTVRKKYGAKILFFQGRVVQLN